jgi:hypothetical protein
VVFRDKEFCRLFEVAVAARRHHIAVGIAAALRAINSPDVATTEDIEAGEAADDACLLADQAVADYQRSPRHHS